MNRYVKAIMVSMVVMMMASGAYASPCKESLESIFKGTGSGPTKGSITGVKMKVAAVMLPDGNSTLDLSEMPTVAS